MSARSSSSATRLRTSGACNSDVRSRTRGMAAIDCRKRDEIARSRRAQRRTPDESFHVVQRLQRLAQLRPFRRPERKLLNRVQPILNPLERDERPQQPAAQEPAAHGRHAAIDFVQQRTAPSTIESLHHLEIPERGRIDGHAIGAAAIADLADVGEIRFLRVFQVLHQGAGGTDRRRVLLEPEALQRVRTELGQQRASRRLEIERPSVGRCQTRRQPELLDQRRRIAEAGRRDDLARPQNRELVGKRRSSRPAGIVGGREFASREIEERRAVAAFGIRWSPAQAPSGKPAHAHPDNLHRSRSRVREPAPLRA